MRSPAAFKQRILASIRLRTSHPVQRFQKGRRQCQMAHGASFRASVAGHPSFQCHLCVNVKAAQP